MDKIEDFKIDDWVREHGPKATIHLHGSNALPLSLRDLQNLAPETEPPPIDFDLKLSYAPSRGNVQLRERIAAIHSTQKVPITADDVVVTPGSILANYVAVTTICSPGDHVICQYPTYGQLYLVPQSNGVDVSLWAMREDQDWALSTDELLSFIKPNTRAIIINNPNNPTGAVIPQEQLEEIVAIARERNITVLGDEVFRPLFHEHDHPPAPLVSLGYENTVSTGSLSKAYGLPGIRLGWVVTKNVELRQKILKARDYTTINVSRLDEAVGAYALESAVHARILERNLAIFKRSIQLVEAFVSRNHQRVSWVKSAGGGTAFLKILEKDGTPIDDRDFASRLVREKGITVIPGAHAFGDRDPDDFQGYVRITLGDADSVEKGLKLLESYINTGD